MSKVQEIHDELIKVIEAELPLYARMPNPYAPDENTVLILKKCYGVAIGPGENTERYSGCIATWRRNYTIILTQQILNTENDVVGRADSINDIDDARNKLLIAIEKNQSLNETAILCKLVSDTGPQYIAGGDGNFVALELDLIVEYSQNLT